MGRSRQVEWLARRLDNFLLGLVDSVGAVRRHVHGPNISRPHHSSIFVWCFDCANDCRIFLVVRIWRDRFNIEQAGVGGLVEVVNTDLTAALFKTIEFLDVDWATWAMVLLSTVLIVTWFVTSSDSGTLVICTMLSIGDTRPPQKFRIFWGMAVSLVAGALLLAGGLQTLQAASTTIAVPFSVVILLMMVGLSKSLWQTETRRYS